MRKYACSLLAAYFSPEVTTHALAEKARLAALRHQVIGNLIAFPLLALVVVLIRRATPLGKAKLAAPSGPVSTGGVGSVDPELRGAVEHFTAFADRADIASVTADLLAENKVVGWFQGRMEFGPRALGARSVLASPLDAAMQGRLNQIKDREDFRPVAPVILEEEAQRWFVSCESSPYMVFVHDIIPLKADRIPAVRHVDGTARVQTINHSQNPVYYNLLKAFAQRTDVPVLINTSFNTRGGPIVCSPRDAVECYIGSPLDVLAIGSFLLEKNPD